MTWTFWDRRRAATAGQRPSVRVQRHRLSPPRRPGRLRRRLPPQRSPPRASWPRYAGRTGHVPRSCCTSAPTSPAHRPRPCSGMPTEKMRRCTTETWPPSPRVCGFCRRRPGCPSSSRSGINWPRKPLGVPQRRRPPRRLWGPPVRPHSLDRLPGPGPRRLRHPPLPDERWESGDGRACALDHVRQGRRT